MIFKNCPNSSGRIDRAIKKDTAYHVYDYKTFPVNKKDMEHLPQEYSFQLGIYKKAIMKLFDSEKVRSFIIFTYTGEMREI